MKNFCFLLALVPTLTLALKFPESAAPARSAIPDSPSDDSSPDSSSNNDAVRAIDEILSASREGRKVGIAIGDADLDKIAEDPELKKLATIASETQGRSTLEADFSQARNYISTKLCSLGLAKCGDKRNGGGSWNDGDYNSIRDVTLVQPVALKPVGHPIAAIPLSNRPTGNGAIPYSPAQNKYGRENYYGSSSDTQGGFIQNERCTCVPVSQCNSYDIVGGNNYGGSYGGGNGNYNGGNYNNGGNYGNNGNYNGNYNNNGNNYNRPGNNYGGNNNNGFITGNGRPSYGQVGNGIDPRNKLNSNIESNATVVEAAPSSSVDARALPDEETTEGPSSGGNRTRRETPRVVHGATNQCSDRYVCCRNPQRPGNRQPGNYGSGGPSSYPPPYYPGNGGSNGGNYNNGGNYGNGNGRDTCGRRNAYGINGRVLNGVPSQYAIGNGDTEFGEYPWQVAILRKEGSDNVFVCGGSLIDSRHVITAAHCIQSHRPQTLRVRMGDWDVGGETEFYPHQDMDVAAIAIHPDFNSGNLFNDIALVKLDGYVETGRYPHISPICLPDKYYDFTGKRCIVTGWGKDAWGHEGKFQHRLKEVDLPVLNHYDCEQKLKRTRLGSNFVLHPGFMCAGGEPSRDACKGDGGGPLACEVNGVWQLAGVISWGVGCGQPDVPGVYVRTSNYYDWIRQNVGY